jgi:UDP-N-acetylglucosamine 2-epimerase
VETIELGWNRLVAFEPDAVAAALEEVTAPAEHPPLYGDGQASQRIAAVIAGG